MANRVVPINALVAVTGRQARQVGLFNKMDIDFFDAVGNYFLVNVRSDGVNCFHGNISYGQFFGEFYSTQSLVSSKYFAPS